MNEMHGERIARLEVSVHGIQEDREKDVARMEHVQGRVGKLEEWKTEQKAGLAAIVKLVGAIGAVLGFVLELYRTVEGKH